MYKHIETIYCLDISIRWNLDHKFISFIRSPPLYKKLFTTQLVKVLLYNCCLNIIFVALHSFYERTAVLRLLLMSIYSCSSHALETNGGKLWIFSPFLWKIISRWVENWIRLIKVICSPHLHENRMFEARENEDIVLVISK